MVYFTGDLVDHGIWETSISGNMMIMDEVHKLFKESFPTVKFFPIIGNHEAHPVNVFSPGLVNASVSSKWLYDYAANVYSQWLPPSAIETIKMGGYYTVLVNPDFRIIALNNNVCKFQVECWDRD